MRWVSVVAMACVAACGARTELDTSFDAGSDAGPSCAPSAETCNGIDDDCDRAVDEGIPEVRCGDGACGRAVRCERGVMPACVPRDPSPEACNGTDDDCDGGVDEELDFGPLGETRTLRTDEGMTTECVSCRWAFDTGLAPIDGGWLAYWAVGFDGGRERPNFYGRRLYPDLTPRTEVALVSDVVATHVEPLSPALVDGAPAISTCFRIGRDDVPGWQFVRPSGAIDSVRGPSPLCFNARLAVGDRVAQVWKHASGPDSTQIHVDVARPDGSDVVRTSFDAGPGTAGIASTAYADRIGVVYLVAQDRRRELYFTRFDSSGSQVGAPRPLPIPYDAFPTLVGTSTGWLAIMPGNYSTGQRASRYVLGVDGDVRSGPVAFTDGRILPETVSYRTYTHHPSEPAIAAVWVGRPVPRGDMHVELFDETGEPTRGWSGPTPTNYIVNPRVTFAEGRLYVIWSDSAPTSMPNRIYAREFGCIP